ncbi:odorant receptor 2a-like [Homalodisca vitripennis]|uniref:odorant receptor 2a-like n=1 Tax=Homalodisca vitripennis TaxID=197043 RepID=UPI001EECA757|nr:odorant receptor 2a-like [Homalodisca vitripennis]
MTVTFAALNVKLRLRLLAEDVRNIDGNVVSRTICRLKEMSILASEKVTEPYKTRAYKECRRNLLKQLVEKHIGIIRRVNLMNACYSLPALFLVQASSLFSALALAQAVQATTLSIWDLVYLVNGGIGSLLMVGFACYFGQMIEDESDNLRRAFYDYVWYNQRKRFKNSIRIMMTVATRPLRLTAGHIYLLNLRTFTSVSIPNRAVMYD